VSPHKFLRAIAGGLALALVAAPDAFACDMPVSVCATGKVSSLPLIRKGAPAAVYVDATADPAVRHAAEGLRGDLGRVSSGEAAKLSNVQGRGPDRDHRRAGRQSGHRRPGQGGKLKVEDLAGQWEGFRQVVVERPVAPWSSSVPTGAARCSGPMISPKGSASRPGIGSPTCRCARKTDLFLTAGAAPTSRAVKYRGFFINDEDPALQPLGQEASSAGQRRNLRARLRADPAPEGQLPVAGHVAAEAFNDDDPRNMVLADEMGVVMGTSHHEPMTRAQDEWHAQHRPGRHRRPLGLRDQRRQPARPSGAAGSSG
jgi:hypothetical protein